MNIQPPHYGAHIPDFKPKIPEKAVKPACLKLLQKWGLHVIRNNTGTYKMSYKTKAGSRHEHWIICGLEGSGDLLTCNPKGRWIEVECKGTTGKQRPEQIERQKYVESIGGLYILAYSIDDLIARQSEIMGVI